MRELETLLEPWEDALVPALARLERVCERGVEVYVAEYGDYHNANAVVRLHPATAELEFVLSTRLLRCAPPVIDAAVGHEVGHVVLGHLVRRLDQLAAVPTSQLAHGILPPWPARWEYEADCFAAACYLARGVDPRPIFHDLFAEIRRNVARSHTDPERRQKIIDRYTSMWYRLTKRMPERGGVR